MTRTPNGTDLDAAVRRAAQTARSAARSSGTEIREIEATHELEAVSRLLSAIWNRDASTPQLTVELLKALSKTGNYVAGIFLDGRLVGAAVAFFAAPTRTSLHSHIAGISDDSQARSVGYALKQHQRAWALSRDISKITWTFDPLVRRNAYFNIGKLGARAVEYLPNFYGEMQDQVNAGDQSDRLLVEWDLLADDVVSACDAPPAGVRDRLPHRTDPVLDIAPDGAPRRHDWHGPLAVVAVPPDIERLRASRSPLATDWRLAVRDVLGGAMAGGARIVGFRRAEGYIVAAADPQDLREVDEVW
ncbi:GNAT family N-acetyltransferase [Actinoallomurus acaciae]|uniref:GNAT family N-acetyltransferase n=1 Tax=Actinoallomurus acaciae TaxID=502577 RepID=A0ABV5YJ94_9ACTN